MSSSLENLENYLQAFVEHSGIPGLIVGVTDREKTLYTRGFGYANIDAKTPMTADHLMEIGSIGKSFTSTVIQQLHDEGRLDIYKPITDYLDWFSAQSEYDPILIHHLLSHTAGIINGTDQSGGSYYDVYALRDTRTFAPPGEKFHYSNVGYKALGLLIEHILDQPYADIIQERVLDPLGMSETDAVITHDTREKMAVGYVPAHDDRPPATPRRWNPATWVETATGDGCIASTVGDMAKYMRMYLNKGHDGVLSDAGFERMTTPVINRTEENQYGHGLAVHTLKDRYVVTHSGGMVGYTTLMHVDVKAGIGVMLMVNENSIYDFMSDGFYIVDVFAAMESGSKSPAIPVLKPYSDTANAVDFVGTFTDGKRKLIFTAEDRQLFLHDGSQKLVLFPREEDGFWVDHPDFTHFLLQFERNAGEVNGVSYGETWYRRQSAPQPEAVDYPEEWKQYVGHYRCHNPWYSNSRILIKQGKLFIAYFDGSMMPLIPIEGDRFRAGDDSPEEIVFDLPYKGQMQRCVYSGLTMYRFFTP